jgi:hypothetical protein
MPLHNYFKGSGAKVMGNMKKEYGGQKGKQVFYATANKMKKKSNTGPSNPDKMISKRASK